MSLKKYFEDSEGLGILATANKDGVLDQAIYAKSHFIDEDNCILLMSNKRSHENICENPNAAYIFIQHSSRHEGKRLSLIKIKESEDPSLINDLCSKKHGIHKKEECEDKKTFVVYFKIDSVRPLIGTSEDQSEENQNSCLTCLEQCDAEGHMCVPKNRKDEKCKWCGSMILNERHLCSDKVKELAYICNSCGRTALKAEYLCKPEKINNTNSNK